MKKLEDFKNDETNCMTIVGGFLPDPGYGKLVYTTTKTLSNPVVEGCYYLSTDSFNDHNCDGVWDLKNEPGTQTTGKWTCD
jgi:hypothetical protein